MQLIKDAIKGCREQWADGLISRRSAPCREYPSQSGTWAKQLLFTTPNSYYRRWLGWRGVPTKSQSYGQWCIAGILMTSVICPIGIFLRGAAERNPFRLCISLHRRNTPSARVPLLTARSVGSIYLFAQFPTPARVLLSRGLSGGSSKPPTHCSRQPLKPPLINCN